MSEEDDLAFPVRFRGYDRAAVDQELYELRTALDYAQAERDRAVARLLTLEAGDHASSRASVTVQWLIDTAEQDAQQIRDDAQRAAAERTMHSEELLRQRIELIEQAQYEADVCRAQAAEEAREIIQNALDKANELLQGLRNSEQALSEIFDSGVLAYRMPPPRVSSDDAQTTEMTAVGPQWRRAELEAALEEDDDSLLPPQTMSHPPDGAQH
ncbi:hypothetical protein CLV71_10537 [Actinophytocola oryzae]|uniref:DivIVA protein n=2 Tax=Actinophytocola oryzae TaxID=502181 RepID=A0A4R7VR05_9PSEU|nr:hypothetical protein CLV71_10537 [Actinophytocola oryzae]